MITKTNASFMRCVTYFTANWLLTNGHPKEKHTTLLLFFTMHNSFRLSERATGFTVKSSCQTPAVCVCFTYLWGLSSSCTAPPPRHVFSLTACTVSQTQSGWCCDTSQNLSSSLAPPSLQSTAWQMSPGCRRIWSPALWGSPGREQLTWIKYKCETCQISQGRCLQIEA